MQEDNKNNESGFAGFMAGVFSAGLSTYFLTDIEPDVSFFIGDFDLVKLAVKALVFSVVFFIFSRFFTWLYSASPEKK